jgi:predicted DNA-binding protein
MKAVEATLNALTTEVRVSREILQRLEATSNRNGNHLP